MRLDLARLMALLPRCLRRHSLVNLLLRLFPAGAEQLVAFNGGGRAWVDLSDPEARNTFITRSFEPDFFRLIVPWLRGGGVFFDGGANFGLCTFGLAAELAHPGVEYHLFEANPRLIPFLDRSLALQLEGRFAVQHGCLAATEGVSRLNFSLESSGQSHLAAHGTEVPNVMLDDYIAHRRIERVTVLKLDIEGSEPLALRGLQRTLQRKAVDVIYVEVLPENLRRLGFTPRDVVSPLHAAGFATYYCREADQRRIPEADWRSVSVNGASLRLALMRDDGPPFGTDLLAVHRDSSLFRFLATA